ncbi:MAG: ABC transporter permease, partial [Tannerella sp.]|jgi:ABC-type antimicrobial peptide transport system permease subunit|nr:ABC transporter permease [Tannerella sp.]
VQNLSCILGLAVGFSAFIFGTYWWYWENHFDTFHPEADRTYAITTTGIAQLADGSDSELNQVHRDDVAAFLQSLPEIENYSLCNMAGLDYKDEDGETAERIMGLNVDTAFFALFSSDFLDGGYRDLPFDNSFILLTEKTARRFFGKTDCAGEVFPLAKGSLKIAGVIRDYPSSTDFRIDFLRLSNSLYNGVERTSFYVQLHRQADLKAVSEKVKAYRSQAKVRFNQEQVKNWSFRLRSLPEVHIVCHPELRGRFLNIRLLGFAGLLALLCSLMNALVLFLARQQRKRAKNKTFRSLGASGFYLFWKSLMDLLLPVMLAAAVTFVLVSVLFPSYQNYTRWEGYGIYENYSGTITLNALSGYSLKWLGLILALFLLAASVLVVRMIRPAGFRSLVYLRNALIVAQIFIGSFFFFVSLSLYRQVSFTQKKDKGIVVDNIVQADVGYYSGVDVRALGGELLRSPHVEAVTYTVSPVLTDLGDYYAQTQTDLAPADYPEDALSSLDLFDVEPDFFDFFGIRLQEGEFPKERNELIVNSTLRQLLPETFSLEKPVRARQTEMRICGVIQDYHYTTMQYAVKGVVFRLRPEPGIPYVDEPYQYVYARLNPENHAKGMEHVNAVLDRTATGKDVAPGKRLLVLTDIQARFERPERVLFRVFGLLSILCIAVVSIGIYSLVALTVEQRRKEIAIRKINGAEIRDILALFLRNYLLLVIAGNVLALPVAYAFMSRWLEYYAYRTALSGGLFALVFVATCLIVLLSIFEKVRRAAKENPAEVIKTE